jgi:hypothetical protein
MPRISPSESDPGGGVQSVVAGAGISVDAADPQNPVVSDDGSVVSVPGWAYFAQSNISDGDLGNPWGGATSARSVVIPRNCTIKNLRAKDVDRVVPAGQHVTLTVFKNGVATALVVTLTTGIQTVSDTTHSVAFVLFDELTLVCSATGGTFTDNIWVWVDMTIP